MSDDVMTSGEAAERLKISESTLRSWHERGQFVAKIVTSGGHRRYLRCDVETLANRPIEFRGEPWHRIQCGAKQEFLSGNMYQKFDTVAICKKSNCDLLPGSYFLEPEYKKLVHLWVAKPDLVPLSYTQYNAEGVGLQFFTFEEKKNSPKKYRNLLHVSGGSWEHSDIETRSYIIPESQIDSIYLSFFKVLNRGHPWHSGHIFVIVNDEALETQ
jgi:hypothetical protein